MKRNLMVAGVVLAIAVCTAGALAQGRGKGPGPGAKAGPAVNCAQTLGLSQPQVAEITKMRTAFWNGTSVLRADMQAVCQELKALGPNGDPKLVDAKNKELAALRAEMDSRRAAFQQAVQNVLTPEQRAKCQQMQKSGQVKGCGVGACGMGACGLGGGNGPGAGMCPAGKGMGPGAGMGRGACGMGAGGGAGAGRGAGAGPGGGGCPYANR